MLRVELVTLKIITNKNFVLAVEIELVGMENLKIGGIMKRRKQGVHIRKGKIVGRKNDLSENVIKVLATIKFHPQSITHDEIVQKTNFSDEDVKRHVRLLLAYSLVQNNSKFPTFPQEGYRVFTKSEKHDDIIKILKEHNYEDEFTSRTRQFLGGYFPTGMDLEGEGIQPKNGRTYPPNVPIIEELQYKTETIRVMKQWRDEIKPFRPKEYSEDNVDKRIEKFKWINSKLSQIYGIEEPIIKKGIINEESWNIPGASGSSMFDGSSIILDGKFSVITYLHEFGHARGFDETDATIWSTNLFKRIFPISYSKLQGSNHTLVQTPQEPFNL